jgi:amidohydrolase
VIFNYGYPVTVNDEKQYKFVKQLLEEGDMDTVEAKPTLAGEDFSYILEKVPGVMWFLAAGGHGGGNHTPTFALGETEMWRGVYMYLKLAVTKFNSK